MSKFTCIAIDDEPLALAKVVSFIEKSPLLELVKSFSDARLGAEYMLQNKVDILFLDIEMEALSGIELLVALPAKPQVILCTAYSQYALKGYELDVCDYLLKPFSFERFTQAANRAISRISSHKTAELSSEFFFVKSDYRLVKIAYADVLYIEGMRDYRCIYTTTGKVITPFTFQKLETMLPPNSFARVHKSYMVALTQIVSIEKLRIKIGTHYIPIGESYRAQFFEQIEG
ncbi:MAG: response regulator transcription factor [Prolixibacteraceae bacterium]|nr:response regulator transcription factor [Prolixibacteraceae bacterium]MBN2648590.1 response regulator transcription factor [Prolixibacteraceae bacterium]